MGSVGCGCSDSDLVFTYDFLFAFSESQSDMKRSSVYKGMEAFIVDRVSGRLGDWLNVT